MSMRITRSPRAPRGKRVSQHYQLGLSQPSLEFLDVVLAADTPLFLDPRAFLALSSDWGEQCVALIQQFFDEVLTAIRDNESDRARLLLSGLHEPNETRLGFTRKGVAGHGVGSGLADDLYASLAQSDAVRTDGLIENLEDTALLIPGIGVDLVSDITTNIVRPKLIEFTVEMAEKYGMDLVDGVDSGALWSPSTGEWVSDHVSLLAPNGRSLLLVPRVVARYKPDYDPGEYYRGYVLRFLQELEVSKVSSPLAYVLKSGRRKGERRVNKKDIEVREKRRYGDGLKGIAVRNTLRYPEILDEYRRAKKRVYRPPDSIEFLAEKIGTPRADWTNLLKGVVDCRAGKADAEKYHRAVLALLNSLMQPWLVEPELEKPIVAGTKKIDIRYQMMTSDGFFKWFAEGFEKIPWVTCECKNLTGDPNNDDVAQIAGRLSKRRGRLGFLVCRTIENRERFLTRCREELNNSDRYIIGVDDVILRTLVEARRRNDLEKFNAILTGLVRELVD